MIAAMPSPRTRRRRALASLCPAVAALGLCASGAATAATTPTFPVPASAKVPGTSTAGATPTTSTLPATAGGSSAPATPTTTYVPGAGTPVPGATPSTPGGATTPTVSIPATAAPAPTASTPAQGAIAAAPAAKASAKKGDSGLSTGAIVIAALAALLVLACIAWGLARRSAYEPHWLLTLRHAMAEAGFRASATWSEFADWVRLGH